jgi:energy-coupling factor transporter transmembrane protein EcfT
MKKKTLYIFNKWWIPVIFCIFTFILLVTGVFVRNNIFDNISFVILGFALLLLVISTVYQEIKRKWWKAILTFLFFCGVVGVFLIYSVILLFAGPYFDGTDRWADDLTIPNDIPIENPVDFGWDYHRPDSVANRQMTEIDFQLYNSFQPGLYEYDVWIGKIENGTIYLKAFEITQEYALSTKSLYKNSTIKIHNSTDSIKRFGTTSHFTIYEGDWGKPYAARFEVWFKPDNGDKKEKY